ncbi:glutathione peroxidase [Catalinimonas sp. 4WD22]|uniref:glutathione peroxidase n=2 Tax=Catalinimonas locisalis TaxID=3133978 RepID=UPI003100D66E
MKKLLFFVSCFLLLAFANPMSQINDAPASFYDFSMNSIEGKAINFSQFKGKKVLLVNVASKCGYTPQYEGLQELNEKYGDKVVVLGFPANNFGGQEPGSNEEIATFCEASYGVTFPMFEKISVKGLDKHPLYRWLSDSSQNGWNDQEPSWNFCKYLVDEEGKLVKFFPSSVKPLSDELIKAIES